MPQGGLPTLLCSRPKAPEQPAKIRTRPAPAPLALESLVERPRLRVRNTFIEGEPQLSPSLGAFYQERSVHTCPSQHIGRLAEFAVAREPPSASPCGLHTPCNIQTPACDSVYEYARSLAAPAPAPLHQAMPLMYSHHPGAELGYAGWTGFAGVDGMAASQQDDRRPRTVLNLAYSIDPNPPAASHSVPHAAPALESAPAADQLRLGSTVPPSLPPPPAAPAPGSAELPSLGSADHAAGCCRPCAFLHTKGCENGAMCGFCHLCGPEETKRRKKEKQALRRATQKVQEQGATPISP